MCVCLRERNSDQNIERRAEKNLKRQWLEPKLCTQEEDTHTLFSCPKLLAGVRHTFAPTVFCFSEDAVVTLIATVGSLE